MLPIDEKPKFIKRSIIFITLFYFEIVIFCKGNIDFEGFLGSIISIATVGGAYFGLNWLYENLLWHLTWIRKATNTPDFSGRWEGWYYDTLEYEWCPTWHIYLQKGGKIVSALARGAGTDSDPGRFNSSEGIAATICTDNSKSAFQVHWSYSSKRDDDKEVTGSRHEGIHILKLVKRNGQDFLEGEYTNNRGRGVDDKGRAQYGTTGRILVKRTNRRLDENYKVDGDWAIPKPKLPPSAEYSVRNLLMDQE